MSKTKNSEAPVAVVLAAGQGTRMRSLHPKVLHEAAGKPLLEWVLDAARAAGCERCLVVIGHGGEDVQAVFPDQDLTWVEQREQLGTGHALAQVREQVGSAERLLVLSGDVPAVRPDTIRGLLEAAEDSWGSMAIADMDEPGSLGRVVSRDDGSLEQIIEVAGADSEDLANRTINAGLYVLPSPEIFDYLAALEPDNEKGELYLTDALVAAAREHRIETVALDDWREALGVNTRADLAEAHRVLNRRKVEELMASGVTVYDPDHSFVEASVEVGRDTILHPGVSLLGATRIGEGCTVGSSAWIRDSVVADGVEIRPYSVLDGAEVGEGTSIGPFSRLRPGTRVGRRARVGNFVEVKNSALADGVKASHLTYLGDAEIGEDANIGAGVITCNYDGRKKHRTIVGEGAFIGSDTMLVAPVEVGKKATTGAGSVITGDVPEGALGVGRSRQRNIPGWADRRQDEDD